MGQLAAGRLMSGSAHRGDGFPINLKAGDRLQIVPNHACVVTNMVDRVMTLDGADLGAVRVEARGCLV